MSANLPSRGLKKRSQSLPRLQKAELKQKGFQLVKLFTKQNSLLKQNYSGKQFNNPDQALSTFQDSAQQANKQKVNQILLKSKSMIQKNQDKIEIAKKFRILSQKKHGIGSFLTGVDIYKEEEQNRYRKCQKYNLQQPQNSRDSDDDLKKILNQKYDDLAQLRKMIKKTSKNLGAYKQQTLSIQKNLIHMADKYGDVAIDVLSRKKIHSNVCDYKDEIY